MHALAAQNSGQGSSGGLILLLLPLVLLAVMFWFSRRRQKQMAQAQREINVGDEVTTTSGLLGRLVAMDEGVATLEIAPGIQVQFDRRAILPRAAITPTATGTPATTDASADSSTDEKA